MIKSGTPALSGARSLLLHCPRCGLSIRPRVRWLAVEHCPRCLARARLPVRLIASGLATNLYNQHATVNRGAHRRYRDRQERLAMSSGPRNRRADQESEMARALGRWGRSARARCPRERRRAL